MGKRKNEPIIALSYMCRVVDDGSHLCLYISQLSCPSEFISLSCYLDVTWTAILAKVFHDKMRK